MLAVGCGSGEEMGLLLAKGAAEQDLVGIDISEELLTKARERFPAATFLVRSMENLGEFDADSFDFVYSSLTFHYANDWQPILAGIKRTLKPGGRLLFSTHHPVKWGSKVERGAEADSFLMGYLRPKDGLPTVFGNYLESREVQDTWFGDMPIRYFHRPLHAIMADIIASGLTLHRFLEPAPVASAEQIAPGFAAIHSRIPLFMVFELAKPTDD